MRLIASRALSNVPTGIAFSDGGILLSWQEEFICHLQRFNNLLEPQETARPRGWIQELFSGKDHSVLAMTLAGSSSLDRHGERVAHCFAPGTREFGLEVSALAMLDDGFLFVMQHSRYNEVAPPVVQRVRFDGTVVWTTTLPLYPVANVGITEVRSMSAWAETPAADWARTPSHWFATSTRIPVSGPLALLCFHEFPRSGIGYGYFVSLADGACVGTTAMGPLGCSTALDDGFLVGYRGYGHLLTLRYGPDGQVQGNWPTYGEMAVSDEAVRVFEFGNDPPGGHIVSLQADGSLLRGDRLEGASMSPLFQHDDDVVFMRNGELCRARGLSVVDRLRIGAPDETIYGSSIVGDGDSVFFAVSSGPPEYRVRLVHVGFG